MLGFFASIGGGVLGKFMKLMCIPYTIPLGIINQYVYPIDICYSEKKQDLTFEGNTEDATVMGGRIGTQQNDLNNVSEYSNVNRNVMRILENNKQISTVSASSVNAADISCDFDKREGDKDFKNMYKTANTWRKHKGIDFSAYHCCPKVNQTGNITITQISDMSSQQVNEIKNEINTHVENTLKETGVGEVDMDASVKSDNEIQNDVYKNIQNQIFQANIQNVMITQGLTYIDRYGMCDPKTVEEIPPNEIANLSPELQQACKNKKCGYAEGKTLKQTIDISTLSKNIINTSAEIMMENNSSIKQTTEVRVNRVGNYRLLVVSFLWNIIMIYLSYFILKKILMMAAGY